MRRAVLAALTAALIAVPAAEAKHIPFGSNLKAEANHAIARPVDTAFWGTKLPGGRRVKVPAKGKVFKIKVKGHAVKKGNKKPVTLFHFQILHPIGDGKVRVSLTSGNFFLPYGGDPQQVNTYYPVNLCAKKGDYVAFSDVGGYQQPDYGKGTPFRIFSNVPAATTNVFTGSGQNNNGDSFKGKPHEGLELLMRMSLGTGDDSGICQG